MKKDNAGQKADRSILLFSYFVSALFLSMAVYMGVFIETRGEEVTNHPYNARLASLADRVVRGSILGNDGTVLARTVTDEEGNETREYPFGSLFAHVVGYAAPGKTGLESYANFYLLSSHDSLSHRIMKELSDEKQTGDNVVTTLDVGLQQIASDALGDRRGAVIAMEPDTGKILAMVSKPSFDPNRAEDDWQELTGGDSTEARLLNRATQGVYPPGSTFKIITALEYMREHPGEYSSCQFDRSGIYLYQSYQIQCFKRTAHGNEDFAEAFANSCNGAFAKLGPELDLEAYGNLCVQLLFNRELPIAIPYSKSIFRMSPQAESWEILQTVIGQGGTLITPMHNLMIISAIANGGILMNPYFIDHVENAGGQTIKKFMPSVYGELMVANEAHALTELLTEVVLEGTGSAVRTEAYQAAGKTGSAEFDKAKETHAWFVGFAPVENPKIAVCVIVEEGGSGGSTAAPIARKLFDAYLLP